MSHPQLFLIPNTLGESSIEYSIPQNTKTVIRTIKYFLAEDEKMARRLIKQLAPEVAIAELSIQRLDKNTQQHELEALLSPLRAGHNLGIISDAGCPAIADPGAIAVRRAHELKIAVVPLVGPCSMVLALMASGLNGQMWRFQGYLPLERDKRVQTIRDLDRRARSLGETQIIMETPYRNEKLLQELLAECNAETLLCVAQGLTTSAESIQTASIGTWRTTPYTLAKQPSLFLLGT